MRIVCLVPSILPYGIQLANALSRTHDVTFATTSAGRDLLPRDAPRQLPTLLRELLADEITVSAIPYRLLKDPRSLVQPLEIVRAVRRARPDVIHLQHTADPRVCMALILLRHYPLVVTVHDVVWQHGAPVRARERMGTVPLRLADAIIVHGHYLRTLYLQRRSSAHCEHVHVVPHGTYTLYFRWAEAGVAEQPDTILFFGRMHPYKGLATMIRVARLLERSMPSARVVIAGTGPELTRRRRELAQLSNVTVYDGFIPNERVARLFQEAAVVALPYEEASQSGVLAIAYAFGKPVVVTNVGSLPEVVKNGDTGFVVARCDIQGFAEALTRVLRGCELRRAMGRRAYEYGESVLGWDKIAEQTTQVYREIAE